MPLIPRGSPHIIARNISSATNTTFTNTTGPYSNGTQPKLSKSRLPWLSWTDTPLEGTSLTSSGLLVLADLSTVAKRTVLKGGSTYVDAFILVPGLHQQQLCESLANTLNAKLSYGGSLATLGGNASSAKLPTIRNDQTGTEQEVTNVAMIRYLHRVAEELRKSKLQGSSAPSRGVTLRIGQPPPSRDTVSRLVLSNMRARIRERGIMSLFQGTLGTLLYVASPVMTAMSMFLMLATSDWWGVGILLALIVARLFNIYIIRCRTAHGRTKSTKIDVKAEAAKATEEGVGMVTTLAPSVPEPFPFPPPIDLPPPQTGIRRSSLDGIRADGSLGVDGPDDKDPNTVEDASYRDVEKFIEELPGISRSPTGSNWIIDLPGSPSIRLQGLPSDLESLVSGSWLRGKTNIEGYLEAASKIIVYGVAACSVNMKQTGSIILGALLVVSAAALALANREHDSKGLLADEDSAGAFIGGHRLFRVFDEDREREKEGLRGGRGEKSEV